MNLGRGHECCYEKKNIAKKELLKSWQPFQGNVSGQQEGDGSSREVYGAVKPFVNRPCSVYKVCDWLKVKFLAQICDL